MPRARRESVDLAPVIKNPHDFFAVFIGERICFYTLRGGKLVGDQAGQIETAVRDSGEKLVINLSLCPAMAIVAVVHGLHGESF